MNRVEIELERLIREVVVNGIVGSPLVPAQIRWVLLRMLGFPVSRSKITARAWFGSRRTTIGHRTYVNRGCSFDSRAPIVIGRDCRLGPQVALVTSTHELGGPEQRAGAVVARPIRVGDGSWLGARVTVLPGVTIGSGCVIAAGAVVVRDCAPNGLYAGVPARRVRDLPV